MEKRDMFSKKLMPVAIASSLLFGTGAAMADDPISANVTMISDYTFRGISQTDEHGAIQGGFDYAHDSGFYAGTWMSNVDFGDGGGSTETDYYGGWAGSTGDWGYDFGVIYYDYWNDADLDYLELAVKVSWKDLSVGANYSDEFGKDGPKYWYFGADYSYSLMDNLSLDLHAGYSDADADDFWEDGEDTYSDWSIGVSTSYFGLDWSLAYVDTSLNDTDIADARALVSMSKSF
jgi:uncharacterized protein (TIGR02001 family)